MLAANAIVAGDAEIGVAGGQEIMSAAPSLMPDALAAVTVPSFANAGFSPASDSAVTP
ncbi:thiolase family protein [Burkholderia multivorans]|uniref:thiolase family protein n=1 Tax=Burkholderia multivorans TaxID=87883 RepID=UPI0035A22E15